MRNMTVAQKQRYSERNKEWRRANPARVKAIAARHRQKFAERYRLKARKAARKWRQTHREEHREKQRQWRLIPKNRIKIDRRNKDWRLRKQYGITLAQHESMYKMQNGLCAISSCARPIAHIDHCHVTGQVRGLLCRQCNLSLGNIEDSIPRVEGLLEYLRKHRNA